MRDKTLSNIKHETTKTIFPCSLESTCRSRNAGTQHRLTRSVIVGPILNRRSSL